MVAVYYFRKKTGKQWKVITPEGKERVVIGLAGFCRENGLNASTIGITFQNLRIRDGLRGR